MVEIKHSPSEQSLSMYLQRLIGYILEYSRQSDLSHPYPRQKQYKTNLGYNPRCNTLCSL